MCVISLRPRWIFHVYSASAFQVFEPAKKEENEVAWKKKAREKSESFTSKGIISVPSHKASRVIAKFSLCAQYVRIYSALLLISVETKTLVYFCFFFHSKIRNSFFKKALLSWKTWNFIYINNEFIKSAKNEIFVLLHWGRINSNSLI